MRIAPLFNPRMPDKDLLPDELATVQAARQANCLALIDRFGTNVAFAAAAGMSVGHVSQLKNGTRKMGEAVARRIEGALDLPYLSMDTPGLQLDAALQLRIEARQLAQDWMGLPEGYRLEVRKHVDALAAALLTLPQLRTTVSDDRVAQYLRPAPSVHDDPPPLFHSKLGPPAPSQLRLTASSKAKRRLKGKP